MSSLDIIALIVTILAVASFSVVFTLLFGTYAKSVIQGYKDGKNDAELITEFVKDKQKEKAAKRKRREVVKRVISSVLMAFVCVFFILALVNKISGNATVVGNKTLMVVASGSMSEKNAKYKDYLSGHDDQFPTYSIIVLEKVDSPEDLKRYDVIAYVNDKGVNIIHRIVNVNSDGTYTTRGDANAESDSDHPPFDRVIGKYTGKYLPTIGVFILFFQSYSGIATILAVIYCMIMMDNRAKAMNDAREERMTALSAALSLDKVENTDNLTVEFIEKLYLDKFIYTIDPSGMVTEEVREEILKDNPEPDGYNDINDFTKEKDTDGEKTDENFPAEPVIKETAGNGSENFENKGETKN